MDAKQRTAQIIEVLLEVASDADPESLDPEKNFRDQFTLDSIDFLNFVLSLEKRLGRKIPEADYPKLSSLNGCLSYFWPEE